MAGDWAMVRIRRELLARLVGSCAGGESAAAFVEVAVGRELERRRRAGERVAAPSRRLPGAEWVLREVSPPDAASRPSGPPPVGRTHSVTCRCAVCEAGRGRKGSGG